LTEAGKRSQRGKVRLLDVVEVTPPVAVAEALDLSADGTAALRHQMLMLDDEPMELAWVYFPMKIAQGTALLEKRLIRGGSPTLLTELGHRPHEWVDRLSTRLPTTEELVTLDLPDDVPILRTLRVVYSAAGRPIEASVLVKGGHLYELIYQQHILE
jgi:GntR family transcriptional regulator